MATGTIFISYRRADSIAHAGRLYDHLSEHFGRDRVFMDVDAIEPGDDFVDVITRKVSGCSVLIAVIGREWQGESAGLRRIDQADDYVRLEVATALDRKIRVIPALVAGARMPAAAELPPDLTALTRRNAVEISDTSFANSIERLIEVLERTLGAEAPPAAVATPVAAPSVAVVGSTSRSPLLLVGVLILAVAAVGGFLYWRAQPEPSPAAAGPTPSLPIEASSSTAPTSAAPVEPTPSTPPAAGDSGPTPPRPAANETAGAEPETETAPGGRPIATALAIPTPTTPACGSAIAWPAADSRLILRWERTVDAARYGVEVDCRGCGNARGWVSDGGRAWHVRRGLGARVAMYSSPVHNQMARSTGTAFRWRVWGIDAAGAEGQPSRWCDLAFSGARPQ